MLPVLDGTWDPKAGAETLAAADKEFDATYLAMMLTNASAQAGLEALSRFAAKWPTLANNVYMIQKKLGLLAHAKEFSDAKTLAEKLIAKSVTRGDTSGLRSVSTSLRDESAKGNAELTALSVRAAEAAHQLDQDDVPNLLSLVEAYAFAADAAKVKEFGPKAIAAAKAAVASDKDAYGTLNVAAAYFAAGDKDQAKAIAEKAINMVDKANGGMLQYVKNQAKKYGAGPDKD